MGHGASQDAMLSSLSSVFWLKKSLFNSIVARDCEGPKAQMTELEDISHAVAESGRGSSPENRKSDLATILRLRIGGGYEGEREPLA